MYPADKLNVDGGFTTADLLDTLHFKIVLNDGTVVDEGDASRSGQSFSYGIYKIEWEQDDYTEGLPLWVASPSEFYSPVGPNGNNCLIGEYALGDTGSGYATLIVTDQFSATYTISPSGQSDITVTRVSLCQWEGPDNFGRTAILRYADGSSANKWEVYFTVDDIYFEQFGGTKTPDQNTPVGDYKENPSLPVGATVA